MKALTLLLTASLLLGSTLVLQAGQEKQSMAPDAKKKAVAEIVHTQLPSYPLSTCLVTGEEFGDEEEPRNVVASGRLMRVCCKRCEKKIRASPDEFIAKVDAAVIKAQTPGYPVTICPISQQPLDAMGAPLDYVHGTRLVRFCCKRCVRAFKKSPEKTMTALNTALIEKQLATYPLDTCLISGNKLGGMGEPIDHLYGTQLVRFCCEDCVKAFEKSPAKHVAKLNAARMAK